MTNTDSVSLSHCCPFLQLGLSQAEWSWREPSPEEWSSLNADNLTFLGWGGFLQYFCYLGLREGEHNCREHPSSCFCLKNKRVSLQSCRISCHLGFCLVGHMELSQGAEKLFVCKSSSLLLLILLLLLGISYSVPVCFQ